MTSQPRHLEFDLDHLAEVVEVMGRMVDARRGWINVEPAVNLDDAPTPNAGFFSMFSGRGPALPFGTWTPPSPPRRSGSSEPAMVGLQHPAGSKAKPVLERVGHPIPEGWRLTQDAARKGLVLAVPGTAVHDEVLRWLLVAGAHLCPIRLTGTWRASVYDEGDVGHDESGIQKPVS